jgi:CRISPR-associated endonuclease/helicase Cas3
VGNFADASRAATGHEPPSWLSAVARDGLPEFLRVPAGQPRHWLILAWLWRRCLSAPGTPAPDNSKRPPRRLIWALPQGAVAEPVAADVRDWLARLELDGAVGLHVAMGGWSLTEGPQWREDMHRPAIIIGTAEVLASKALNRGLGSGRNTWPIEFALVTNGAHWVVHDAARSEQAVTTLREVEAATRAYGTAEPFALTALAPPEQALPVYPRLRGTERAALRVLGVQESAAALVGSVASAALAATPVLVATSGPSATDNRDAPAGAVSRGAQAPPTGTSAQVAAHGQDAPWSALATGGWWAGASTAAAVGPLASTEPVRLLRPTEFLGFFDTSDEDGTARDSGEAVPFVSDGAELDVAVAWATWAPGPDGGPDPDVRWPAAEHRCPVPRSAIPALARARPVWRRGSDGWERLPGEAEPDLRPFELLLVNAADGGYDPELGFDPASGAPVPGCPRLLTPDELAALVAALPATPAGPEAAEAAEEPRRRPWQTLDQHSEQVRDQARALLAVLDPAVRAEDQASAVVAGYLHDVGKGHPTWQDALCALAPEEDQAMVAAGRPWAKSGHGASGRLEFAGGVSFRHELASLLLINGPRRDLLAAAPDPDLCRYLVLAHHGRLRTHVADPEPPIPGELFGLADGAVSDVPPALGRPASTLTAQVRPFAVAAGGSPWSRTARALAGRLGPFRLAYLEAVVRIADWRASGGRELPG